MRLDANLIRESEIQEVEKAIQIEKLGETTEETKHVRVRYGIYSMRNQSGRYVVRIRVPSGIIAPDHLRIVADLVENYGTLKVAHFTTRQGIQIAGVAGEEIGAALRLIESAGLTTRKTGGNVVRNIVCCPLAGVSQTEFFDVTPYAIAADKILKDDSACQSFPRKIKIAFEGCAVDHVRTLVSDIGLRAEISNGRKGFRIFVGGGLGAIPMTAQLLEDFTPEENLLPTLKAILAVFNLHGDRSNRNQARIKWLIKSNKIDWFRNEVFSKRTEFPAEKFFALETNGEKPRESKSQIVQKLSEPFLEWKAFNLKRQKQRDYYTAMVRCPFGDLQASQIRRLADIAEKFSGASLRLTIEQNIALRWIPESSLYTLYEELSQEGLSSCCAEKVMDVTRCVGAEACISAITNPIGATRAIASLFSNGLKREASIRNLRIRVSGCLHGCSHHSLSDIGLYGMAKKFNDRMVPHYSIRLGGDPYGSDFAQKAVDVPAVQVSKAVERILKFYIKEKSAQESFTRFVGRMGLDQFKNKLDDLTQVPSPEQGPEFYRDLDSTRNFALEAKEGECHA